MHMDISVFQKPKKGNYYCGDSYYYKETEQGFICALADGLGSGEYAKESSQLVMDIIESNTNASVEQIIKVCNQKLVGKRGVVLGILKVDFNEKNYTFSSIGNIGLMTISSKSEKKRNIPNAGYIGGFPRPLKVLRDNLLDEMVFVMFSDGVDSLDLSSSYFLGKDVSKITELFSHFLSDSIKDDTTLLVMKYNA
ncbi:indirect negative regulator of sigma-B activity [Paraliobacillus sp. PM-2]|uniref:indirect negative regulator of sigma-B activity n=1 Tax=Paraliobacillus sp. PM-2 TaxID=1462524 RepID=UPI002100204C|nr:indirect negative regulator of sigma-B activity [Paraliobacillus sp. PM-2]